DLKPHDAWPRGITLDRLVGDMRARLADIPGIDANFSQPIKDNIEENISGINGQVAIKLFGDDLDALRRSAVEVKRTLEQVPRVESSPGQAAIDREANMRFVGVKCNVRGRDLGGFVAEAQRRVAAEVQLPPNSFLTWGGEFENQRRAMARLAIIVPVSIGLILAILMRTFGSLACALLILATIPFALVGGVVGLDVAGLNLSVAACIGLIA